MMKESSLMQLLPYDQRIQRQSDKRTKFLSFLSNEIFTSAEVAGIVMNISSRQAVYKTLACFESEGLIRRDAIILSDSTKRTLWGITSNGIGWAFDPAKGQLPGNKTFEPSRVSGAILQHTLDVQKIRLAAELYGWTEWRSGDRLEKWGKNVKRPDAIAKDCNGCLTAIEVERTFKSIKRYQAILSEYLQLIKKGVVSRVIWVSPDNAFSERLKTIITSIQEINVAGQKVKIDHTRHHQNLYFCSYAQFPPQ